MRDDDIDEVLRRAAGATPDVDPALLDRVSRSIGSSLRPVRPLPPSWVLIVALVGACTGVATAGATMLGPHGVQRMNVAEIGMIFPTLGILIWLAAVISVREMIPGSPRRMAAWLLPAMGSLVLLAVFALLFRDYSTERFLAQGITCLTAGLLHAIPTGLACWWILHRGFAVNTLAAGLAQGSLAGLAGVSMLELHCGNFEAPHVMLWHTAVLPLGAALGALLAWAIQSAGASPRARA